MHTGASYRRSRVITGPSHLGVYGPCVFIRCVIEKAKKTAQLGSKSSAFDGRVLLGLDRLGLNPVSQRHVTSGSCAGVWLIGCDPTDETDRCCSECGAAGRVRSSWRRRLYLVKSMFRVSSLIFFGCEKHCRTRPTNIEAIQALQEERIIGVEIRVPAMDSTGGKVHQHAAGAPKKGAPGPSASPGEGGTPKSAWYPTARARSSGSI